MQKTTQNKLLKVVNFILMLGVFYFAFFYGKDLLAHADFSALSGRWWILIFAFVLFFTAYLISAWHWLRICRLVDEATPAKQMIAFFASQPFKYLPSSLFTFSYRAKFAKELGLSLKQSSLAQLIENFNLIGSGLAVTILFYAISYSYLLGTALLVAGLLVAGVLIKYDVVIPIFKTNRKILTRKVVPNFLLVMVSWTIAGLSFLMVNFALGLSVNPWLMISANTAAYVVSILAVFAPGGIGVRELALSFFSANNSAIVLWRLLTFFSDIVLGFGAIVFLRTKFKNTA
jgi:uncharacterized membrane protein YbhN (UPF0104 family)